MAWPARTWVAGELVYQSLGNAYWRDPMTDLRGGGVAIASQATGDFLTPSSGTQLSRVAGVAGRYPSYNGSAWVMANAVQDAAWPIGSIYESVLATNPATLLGVGTWAAHGIGRATVGIDAGDADFDTVGETSGSKTHQLTIAEIPSHNHVQDPHTHLQNSHNHTQDPHSHTVANVGNLISVAAAGPPDTNVIDNSGTKATSGATAVNQATTATNNATTATNQNTGSDVGHNNLQAYIVFYRWKRTA